MTPLQTSCKRRSMGYLEAAWLPLPMALAVSAAAVWFNLPSPDVPAAAAVASALPAAHTTAAVTADDTAPQRFVIDPASLDWARLPVEPDPSPLSVAAYGN